MYLIYNNDGSIKFAITSDYIMQGSNNVNHIDIAVDNRSVSTYTCDCLFTLPNSSTITLAGSVQNFAYSGINYSGYRIWLSSAVLAYAGTLHFNIRLYNSVGDILYTYQYSQTVNASSLSTDWEAPITQGQYNSFMALLTTYINAYDTHLIRKYATYAEAVADIDNLSLSQHVLVDSLGTYNVYYKSNATTLTLLNVPTNWTDIYEYIGITKQELTALGFNNLVEYINSNDIQSISFSLLTGVLTATITLKSGLTKTDSVDLGSNFNTKQVQLEIDNAQNVNINHAQNTADTAQSTADTAVANAQTAQNTADEALAVANTKNKSYSFDTYDDMKSALASAVSTIYHVGDNLFIVASDSPDYWVSKVNVSPSGDYGYYEIKELEIDTAGFAKQVDLDTTNGNVATNTSDITYIQDNYATDLELAATNQNVSDNANEIISIKANYATTASLSAVATSGSYNDLTNKPTIPTDVGELTNNVGYITATNYAGETVGGVILAKGLTGSETDLVEVKIDPVTHKLYAPSIPTIRVEIVANLPVTGVDGTLYLVPIADPTSQNLYDEYMWVNSAWEKLGAVTIDLSSYATITYVNSAIANIDLSVYSVRGDISNGVITFTDLNLTTFANTIKANKHINFVPNNTSLAKIDMAYKYSPNLIVLADVSSTTKNGITYSIKNGVITLNGTATASFTIILATLGVGTYSLSLFNNFVNATSNADNIRFDIRTSTDSVIATYYPTVLNAKFANIVNSNNTNVLVMRIGTVNPTYTNYVYSPMLIEATTLPTTFIQGLAPIMQGSYVDSNNNLYTATIGYTDLAVPTGTYKTSKLDSQAFIVNGSVAGDGTITFSGLVVADLISAVTANTIIIFKPTTTYKPILLAGTINGSTYTLNGSLTTNDVSNITNYECIISVISGVASGTYTAKQPTIPIATSSVLGGVKGGADGTSIDANGVINFKPIIPVATLADLPALNQTNYDKHLFYMPSDGFSLRYMAKELGVWQLSTTSLTSDEYCGIAYGNGKFVVVSDTGTGNAYYSTDGNTWNACTGISGILYSVAYGNGRFVAVGDSAAFYSSDGISWTAITTTDVFLGIAYGNGRFIAVGGAVKALADGATAWTSITSAISGTDLNSVCYDTDRFIMVGQTAKSQYLLNGSTTCVLMTGNIGTDDLYSVAYNSTRYVAVGANGRSIRSTNGTSWQNMGNNGLSSQSYYSIIPYGTRFLCLGANGSLYELIQGSNVWGILTNSLSSTTGQGASLCYDNAIIIASYGQIASTKVEYNTTETFVWRVNTSI